MPKHAGVDCYQVYVFVCASNWSYKMNYISLHGMNNITIFTSEFPIPKQGKKFMSIPIFKHFSFEVQPNKVLTLILYIFICGEA
jgi:hypothetical protein